jgi:hypothetical protein
VAQVRPDQVLDIVNRWVARGKPYCAHDRVATIQDMGVPPEDYCCLDCGEVWAMGYNSKKPPPLGGDAENDGG